MILAGGKIVPGKAVGEYVLGMDETGVLERLRDSEVCRLKGYSSHVYGIENARFWFDSAGRLIQIGVTTGFTDKYDGRIGIGNTLTDIRNLIGEYYQEHDDYLLTGIKGIAFQLADVEDADDEWDELKMPIEWIFVYKC